MAAYTRVNDVGISPGTPNTPWKEVPGDNHEMEYMPYQHAKEEGQTARGYPPNTRRTFLQKSRTHKIRDWLKVLLFPTVALTFIIFCFVVHYHDVFIEISNPNDLCE
jgi:hypothetical protein